MLFSVSCRSARLLEDGQHLIVGNELKGVNREFEDEASEYIQRDIRPNSPIRLSIYNFANGKNGAYRTDRIRQVGEAPHILDSNLIDISSSQIQRFLQTKGYFNASVRSEVTFPKKKKAEIEFSVDQGEYFKIRDTYTHIEDPKIDSIYESKAARYSVLEEGNRFDSDSLAIERERIYNLMRQNGYYDYLRQYVRFEVDTNLHRSQADIHLLLDNPEDRDQHTVFYIDSSFITIKNSDGGVGRDSSATKHQLGDAFQVEDFTHRFRPYLIKRYIFQKKDDRFNIDQENLTYDRLYELNTFRTIKITYDKLDSNRLNAHYELQPLKRMSNRVEAEYTFASGRSGFNIGNTYTNRNLFGGSEQLEVKARYGTLFDSRFSGPIWNRVWNRDFQVGANLSIPRLIVPFRIPIMGKNSMPHTIFSTNWQIFDQVNTYSNRYNINSISYQWYDTRYKWHTVTPLLIEFRDGRLSDEFRNYLDTAGFELYIRSNDRAYFGLGSQYAYTYNALRLNTFDDFTFFRGAIDLSGNTLSLLSSVFPFPRNEFGERTVAGVPFLQYTKMEVDFRKYWHFGDERQLIARFNGGIAVPYGNNNDFLIFEKQFFAGGMNDIRAWQARTLGPGNYNRAVLPDSLRVSLRNLDQLGEIKMVGNLEYRFKLLNSFLGAKLKGAAFTDFGNIWRLNERPENPGGEIRLNRLFDQLAIGAGAGLRFDLDYFVFRFDAGFKVKDPQFLGADQWVITDLFRARDFRERYQQTNAPDPYNFVQYNFGIGMPF